MYSDLFKVAVEMKKTTEQGKRFLWKIVKLLKFTKDVDIVLFKETLNTSKDFKTLNVRRRGHSRNLVQLPVSYQGPIPISCQKKKNFWSCCRSFQIYFIPFTLHFQQPQQYETSILTHSKKSMKICDFDSVKESAY